MPIEHMTSALPGRHSFSAKDRAQVEAQYPGIGDTRSGVRGGTRLRGAVPLLASAIVVIISGCKDVKPEPTCAETIVVSTRNGVQAIQAINGLYLRHDFPVSSCASRPFNESPYERKYVSTGDFRIYWKDGKHLSASDYAQLASRGELSASRIAIISVLISFPEADQGKARSYSSWWFEPRIPHQIYPIDLLPNFALERPDPDAGTGRVKSQPSPYWAVRGTREPLTAQPNTTFCSVQPPSDWDGKDFSDKATKARDVAWLTTARVNESEYVSNTCRGHTSAANGKPISAMVDVPGMAVRDIDVIYRMISQTLSEMTID